MLESVNCHLIAAEGRYHKACHASYTCKVNLERKQRSSSAEENVFDEVFHWLMTTIIPDTSVSIFKTEIEKRGNATDNYTKQKLKARLTANFKEQIAFYQTS